MREVIGTIVEKRKLMDYLTHYVLEKITYSIKKKTPHKSGASTSVAYFRTSYFFSFSFSVKFKFINKNELSFEMSFKNVEDRIGGGTSRDTESEKA